MSQATQLGPRASIYFLVDRSASTAGDVIKALNNTIQLLKVTFRSESENAKDLWVSLISFAEDACVDHPLVQLADFAPPVLSPGGSTSLGRALRLVGESIAKDLGGRWVNSKPIVVVFLASNPNSIPTEEWQQTVRALEAKGILRPRVVLVACGLGVRREPLSGIYDTYFLKWPVTTDRLQSFLAQFRDGLNPNPRVQPRQAHSPAGGTHDPRIVRGSPTSPSLASGTAGRQAPVGSPSVARQGLPSEPIVNRPPPAFEPSSSGTGLSGASAASPGAAVDPPSPQRSSDVASQRAAPESDLASTEAPRGEAAKDQPSAPPRLTDEEVLAKSRTLWQEVEPTEVEDPVEHTLTAWTQVPSGPRVVAASRRGRSHAQDGQYREDSFAFGVEGDWTVVAVADGAGSKPLARVGSQLACSAAVDYLRAALKEPQASDGLAGHLRGALAGAMASALAQVGAEAARRNRDIEDFSTTLILVAYRDDPSGPWLATAQVGDGGVAVALENDECSLLGNADRGSFGGETLFLTSRGAQLTWGQRAYPYQVTGPAIRMLVVATDGVLDDFTPPYGELVRLFDSLKPIVDDDAPDQRLLEWLAYEKRGSFDDRTLVALIPSKTSQAGSR